jgi:hypothetical protein
LTSVCPRTAWENSARAARNLATAAEPDNFQHLTRHSTDARYGQFFAPIAHYIITVIIIDSPQVPSSTITGLKVVNSASEYCRDPASHHATRLRHPRSFRNRLCLQQAQIQTQSSNQGTPGHITFHQYSPVISARLAARYSTTLACAYRPASCSCRPGGSSQNYTSDLPHTIHPPLLDLRPEFFFSTAGIHAINADEGVKSSFPAINGHQSSFSSQAALIIFTALLCYLS